MPTSVAVKSHNSFFAEKRRFSWVDAVLLVGLVGIVCGLFDLAREWTGELRPTVEINLSPWALPQYTFFSLSRGCLAYVLSLAFSLAYGYWAAKDPLAERVLVPLLDVLQSIPVLGFMPGLVLALAALFPHSNIGLEMAAVVMIFTGQAWNMTFSFYYSLRSVPLDYREAATMFGFSPWRRFRWVELPQATIGLVWNSMMSMAGGWFFLMINEAFRLGDRDYRLPGVGSYMSAAVEQGRFDAMLWALLAMTLMIVSVDQLFWRPILVWAQKFRDEEGTDTSLARSWFLDLLRRSRISSLVSTGVSRLTRGGGGKRAVSPRRLGIGSAARVYSWISPFVFACCGLAAAYFAWRLFGLLRGVSASQWLALVISAACTLGRVLASTAIGTLWAVPAGLAIGLFPRVSRIASPVVQVVASFPAPMLFPIVIGGLTYFGVSLDMGSILLMLLGTQWYILFNIIAGATAIPADLKEAARGYRLNLWRRFWMLYLPAVFPYLVTGWVTAAGGAWNASIVAEYASYGGKTLVARGLGAEISQAAAGADFPLLAASILVMSAVVVGFNRLVWRRFRRLAEQRFSLNK